MIKPKDNLEFDETDKLLSYDPETGNLTWKINRCGTAKAGMIAGHLDSSHGYRIVRVNGERYRAHRVAWLLHYKEMPTERIDHINRNRDDNSIKNLRCVDKVTNHRNAKKPKNNTSGHVGVSWNKRDRNWRAAITVNNQKIILGGRANINDAIKLRKDAELKYGFHENHGKIIEGDIISLVPIKRKSK